MEWPNKTCFVKGMIKTKLPGGIFRLKYRTARDTSRAKRMPIINRINPSVVLSGGLRPKNDLRFKFVPDPPDGLNMHRVRWILLNFFP